MDVSILTIFPELFDNFWSKGIVKRAADMGKLTYSVRCIRDFALGAHRITDDRPFGGGCGMVMKPEPIVSAIRSVKREKPSSKVILLSPQGKKLNQSLVTYLSSLNEFIFICGRYEGVDERVMDHYVDLEISIGDYVLTGGELPAMVVVDTIVRLIPGVLGNPDSAVSDTFSDGLVKYAQYTRPQSFEGELVPEILVSGDHAAIERWQIEMSLIRTLIKRKDLLYNKRLTLTEIDILNEWRLEIEHVIQEQFLRGSGSSSGS